MATVELTNENFDQVVAKHGIVVVDCWSPWCGSCRAFAPIYGRVAAQHPEHVFAKLNTQAESGLTESLGVKHVPTLVVYRDGYLLFQQAGNFGEETLCDIVARATSVDIDARRAEQKAPQTGVDTGPLGS